MALLINDNCTACDACKPACPNEAISVGDPMYIIDPLRCTSASAITTSRNASSAAPRLHRRESDFQESPDELMAKYESLAGLEAWRARGYASFCTAR